MKVKCINPDNWLECDRTFLGLFRLPDKDCEGPAYGDVVTVQRKYWHKGKLYYDLVEWPSKSDNDGFDAEEFLPLDEFFEQVTFKQLKKPISVN